jgi:hypothetical protein
MIAHETFDSYKLFDFRVGSYNSPLIFSIIMLHIIALQMSWNEYKFVLL